jgi:hypothetical protein
MQTKQNTYTYSHNKNKSVNKKLNTTSNKIT